MHSKYGTWLSEVFLLVLSIISLECLPYCVQIYVTPNYPMHVCASGLAIASVCQSVVLFATVHLLGLTCLFASVQD